MDALSLLKKQFDQSVDYFERTMADVTPELAQQTPPGKAHTIAGYYGHYVLLLDMMVNMMLRGGQTLYDGDWKGKTGFNEMVPPFGEDWSAQHSRWAREVQIDLPAAREYAQAVYASVRDYLAILTDDALDQPSNLLGAEHSLGEALALYLNGHTLTGTGEISAIKGVLGVTGFAEGAF